MPTQTGNKLAGDYIMAQKKTVGNGRIRQVICGDRQALAGTGRRCELRQDIGRITARIGHSKTVDKTQKAEAICRIVQVSRRPINIAGISGKYCTPPP